MARGKRERGERGESGESGERGEERKESNLEHFFSVNSVRVSRKVVIMLSTFCSSLDQQDMY